MIPEQKDAELFYSLWLPLLDFVNINYRINARLVKKDAANGIDPYEVKAVADYVWTHTEVIDEYLAETAMLDEHREIVAGWKKCIPGEYVLERHLKKGSVFISMEDKTVYMVCGIYSSWEEMFSYRPLPILLEAVLIPFRDKIITEGLAFLYNFSFGKGYSSCFKDIYMNAKKNKTIRFSL